MVEPVCPVCRSDLEVAGDDRRCPSCGRCYPFVAGILDLRVSGDRYLSLEADRDKAVSLASVGGGFEEVLHAYWERTPEVPPELARRYVRATLDGERRASVHVDRLGISGGSLLDVGCGTGGMLVAAAGAGARPTGVDIALRWLVVAARALAERGVDATLIAADGALLPFRPGAFDIVTCIETLEHAADQRGLLHWCTAATSPGGRAYIVTANRFSVVPEPTVGVWGAGWLPRRLGVAYVERRRNTRYSAFRPLSVSDLGAMLGPSAGAAIAPAALPPAPVGSSRARRVAERLYGFVRSSPLSPLLRPITPYLEITVRR